MHLTCPPSELRHASAQCPPASMNTPPRRACSCSPTRACAGRAQANQVQHTLPGLQTRCATLHPPSRRLTPRVVLPPHDQLACPQPLKGDCSEMLRVAWNMTATGGPRPTSGRQMPLLDGEHVVEELLVPHHGGGHEDKDTIGRCLPAALFVHMHNLPRACTHAHMSQITRTSQDRSVGALDPVCWAIVVRPGRRVDFCDGMSPRMKDSPPRRHER